MNSAGNCLGPGNRANATIGRALRLVAMNLVGARAGAMDGSSQGNPGKYSFCFAESPPIDPWGPLRVDLGYAEEDTTVTILAAEAPRQMFNVLAGEPEQLVRCIASSVRSANTAIAGKRRGQSLFVFGPEHAAGLRDGGWTREQVRERIAALTRVTEAELLAGGQPLQTTGAEAMVADPDGSYPTFEDPADAMIVCAGGGGAGWSCSIPAWAPSNSSRSVTERVLLDGAA